MATNAPHPDHGHGGSGPGSDAGDERTRARPATKLLLSIDEAAEQLSVSRDSFDRHVVSELRVVSVGRRLLVPRAELEHYVERHAAVPLADGLSRLRR